MEKNKLTKELLAENFHDLMLHKDFEKITIKNITDQAGVIRPTFYYHFQDKYDVLEYILQRDVFDKAVELVRSNKEKEALRSCFAAIEQDKEFYRRAFRVKGQNAFDEMVDRHASLLWEEAFRVNPIHSAHTSRLLRPEIFARYYGNGMSSVIRIWIEEHRGEVPGAEIADLYETLISHSVFDMTGK